MDLLIAIMKSIFIAIPIWICYIAVKDKVDRMEEREFKIETPVGTISSDSGNHVVDVLSVTIVFLSVFIIKRIMSR